MSAVGGLAWIELKADVATDLSVDLRDALGDRLYLSDGFRRDGVSRCRCASVEPLINGEFVDTL